MGREPAAAGKAQDTSKARPRIRLHAALKHADLCRLLSCPSRLWELIFLLIAFVLTGIVSGQGIHQARHTSPLTRQSESQSWRW